MNEECRFEQHARAKDKRCFSPGDKRRDQASATSS